MTRAKPIEERFWPHIAAGPNGCWVWTRYVNPRTGYGQVWFNGTTQLAHRVSLHIHDIEIPEGMQVDHLCRNRPCVRPVHLEVVTPRTNSLRSDSPAARNARKTHCVRGHVLEGRNIYVGPRGGRWCRLCWKERNEARDRRVKVLGLEPSGPDELDIPPF